MSEFPAISKQGSVSEFPASGSGGPAISKRIWLPDLVAVYADGKRHGAVCRPRTGLAGVAERCIAQHARNRASVREVLPKLEALE